MAERREAKAVRPQKKVIVLLVDSLLPDSIDRVVAAKQAPALSFFINNGIYRRDLVSSFPTMSVTIDSTFLTGAYADEHHVPGLLWFDQKEQRIIDYGDGMRVVWKPGVRQWLGNSYKLNHVHLSPKVRTLHEDLYAEGYATGSINGIIYRGNVVHQVGMGRITPLRLYAPDLFGLGAFAKVTDDPLPSGPFQAMGINDRYTAESLISLIKRKKLPDVTIAYFPDLDGELHKRGPADLEGVIRLDRQLQRILHAFGDWRRALDQHLFVIMGDSGVTKTREDSRAALIDLEAALHGYRINRLGRKAKAEDDVAIAVNGRMSYVYSLSPRVPVERIAGRLIQDQRIDLLAWKQDGWIHVRQGGSGMALRFRRGGSQLDRYGQSWQIAGDPRVLDLAYNPRSRRLESRNYPDGLRRLESVFRSHEGNFLVLNATPGTEFSADGAPNHPGGGNHGSLHRSDALFPLIVSGTGNLPAPPARLVDLKEYVKLLLRKGSTR
jgi:predicted AlkP superfamily pyrophosphatase or phosphodiesterase